MIGSGQPIIQARISQIRRLSNLQSLLNNAESKSVNKFKDKIKEDDEHGAFAELQACSSQAAEVEMLRIAVNSRKNDLVINFLHITAINKQEAKDCVDATVSRHPMCSNDFFQNAVLYSTLNDDPETLEAVLEWGTINSQEASEENRSMLIALLENYTQCIRYLYKFGYKIRLPDEDRERIESVLTMDNAHFYFSLVQKSDQQTCLENFKSDLHRVGKKSLKYDPVERFLRFKASANPLYISTEFIENSEIFMDENHGVKLRLLDPIRKSFALVQYSKLLAYSYTQHSAEYIDISKKCQDFAQDVLEQCDNIQEVEMLLEYSPDVEDDEDRENTNWHLALWEGHKKFVGHHYFQNFIWDKITGKNFNWDNYFLFWRILYFPLAVLLFCFVPLVVLLDTLFRKSDILFVSPQMLKKRKNKKIVEQAFQGSVESLMKIEVSENENAVKTQHESPFFSFFRERIHRPIFRMIVYHFLEIVFLVALGFSMYDPKDTTSKQEFWVYDFMTFIFVINYFFEDVVDIFRRKWNFFSSFWNVYSLINHTLFMLGGFLAIYGFKLLNDDNRANLSGNHIVNIGSTFVSIAASMAFFRTVRWLLLHRTLGPVVVCIIRVLKDTVNIFVLFFIIYVSFAIGTFSMFKPFTLNQSNVTENGFKMKETELANVKGLFSAMFWRLFDPGENDMASIVNGDGEVSLEFSHFIGLAFWAVYQTILVILLVNIFIAMMNTTYTKVSERADLEWKYSKSYYQVQFLAPRAVLPPPFRMLYYFAKLMYISMSYDGVEDKEVERETKNKDYLNLLLKLVRTKQHSDYENSIQDDFSDLRQDLKNMVSEKQKSIHNEIDNLKKIIIELKKEIISAKDHVAHSKRAPGAL